MIPSTEDWRLKIYLLDFLVKSKIKGAIGFIFHLFLKPHVVFSKDKGSNFELNHYFIEIYIENATFVPNKLKLLTE